MPQKFNPTIQGPLPEGGGGGDGRLPIWSMLLASIHHSCFACLRQHLDQAVAVNSLGKLLSGQQCQPGGFGSLATEHSIGSIVTRSECLECHGTWRRWILRSLLMEIQYRSPA